MAIVNANYEFLMVDCGVNGRISDGGVLQHTRFYRKLQEKKLHIPNAKAPNNSDRPLPYVFVGDEAFSLTENFMKPFDLKLLVSKERRMFNYRLSRCRRIVENAFGILAARFQILKRPIDLRIDRIKTVILACCWLRNFLRKQIPNRYVTPQCTDTENDEVGRITLGLRMDPNEVHDLQRGSTRRTSRISKGS
jgi:hypothetical protein